MKKSGLHSWRKLVDAQVREKKLALARARQLAGRCAEIEEALLAERARRDDEERRRREAGELPDFARERMTALLERALERAREKLAAARTGEERALAGLRESFTRATAVERLIDRRDARDEADRMRAEQKEIDEVATRRAAASLTETRR
ncbi:MAG: hypothetical protein JNL90_04380 [Planctomycetes bacterium]|nr:hypothetical protein [Planctomycetota bacterium]